MQVINKQMVDYEREKDTPGNDIFSTKLILYKDVKEFFIGSGDCKDFCEQIKTQIAAWLEKLKNMVKSAEQIREA